MNNTARCPICKKGCLVIRYYNDGTGAAFHSYERANLEKGIKAKVVYCEIPQRRPVKI